MSQKSEPQSIASRQKGAESDAAIEQMFGYFSRKEQPRKIVSELDALQTPERAA